MDNLVLILTSSAIAAVLLVAGTIEVFAYRVMIKHIITLDIPPNTIYKTGDGILHEGKKYVVIHVGDNHITCLKTLSNIINDWRSK